MVVALQWIKQGTNLGHPSIEKGGGFCSLFVSDRLI